MLSRQLLNFFLAPLQFFMQPADVGMKLLVKSAPGKPLSVEVFPLFLLLLVGYLLHLQQVSLLSQTFLQSALTRERIEVASILLATQLCTGNFHSLPSVVQSEVRRAEYLCLLLPHVDPPQQSPDPPGVSECKM